MYTINYFLLLYAEKLVSLATDDKRRVDSNRNVKTYKVNKDGLGRNSSIWTSNYASYHLVQQQHNI